MINKLREFLDQHHIKYRTISHSQAFTAQEIAASAHVPGRKLAKTVMVRVNDGMAMAVLPACYQVDFDLLKKAIGAGEVELADEQDFQQLFPECELGAMPPFGNLYGMDVFVTQSLTKDEEITFNAGSHTELICMSYRDFEKLVKPKVAKFSGRF